MSKGCRYGQEEAFVRAYTDLIADIESHHAVWARCHLSPSSRRGVLTVRHTDHPSDKVLSNEPALCSLSNPFPNATSASLEAFLFQQAIKLANLLGIKPVNIPEAAIEL